MNIEQLLVDHHTQRRGCSHAIGADKSVIHTLVYAGRGPVLH
jgi:hypothetical protein